MKFFFISLSIILMSMLTVNAQKGIVTLSYSYMSSGQTDMAKHLIDKAMANDGCVGNARGHMMYCVATQKCMMSGNAQELISKVSSDDISKVWNSYITLKSLDTKGKELAKMPKFGVTINDFYKNALFYGIEALYASDFSRALECFSIAVDVTQDNLYSGEKLSPLTLYLAQLSAAQVGNRSLQDKYKSMLANQRIDEKNVDAMVAKLRTDLLKFHGYPVTYTSMPVANTGILKFNSDNSEQGNVSDMRVTSYTPSSDVDVNIPKTSNVSENTFVVIIANEEYRKETQVEFAMADGQIFKQYCNDLLGIPNSNIHYIANATLNDMRAEINWVCQVAEAYKGEARIIFYYAGHGIPDEATYAAYLLPCDGYGSDIYTGYKLSDLYANLAAVPTTSTVVLLDACFSGSTRGDMMLASARGVALKVKPDNPIGNLVVLSAASNDETAFPYREKGHGLFTYFLLKKLQSTNGNVTLGELSDYIQTQVSRRSIVNNSKSQTPCVIVSPSLKDSWGDLKLIE